MGQQKATEIEDAAQATTRQTPPRILTNRTYSALQWVGPPVEIARDSTGRAGDSIGGAGSARRSLISVRSHGRRMLSLQVVFERFVHQLQQVRSICSGSGHNVHR